MEVLKKLVVSAAVVFLLAACEYLGFGGYLNQLEELGITPDLADAVTFDQHLISRPREFRGTVYVLGTRGVFAMDSERLSSYDFYPYDPDLGYDIDYDDDNLPPINCFATSEGQILITLLNSGFGRLGYGDELRLYENPRKARFSPVSSQWSGDLYPLGFYRYASGDIDYVVTDPYNDGDFQDSLGLWDTPGAATQQVFTPVSEYLLNSTIRTDSAGSSVYCVTQIGIPVSGFSGTVLSVYSLNDATWNFTVTLLGSVTFPDGIYHGESRNGGGEFISRELHVSTNDRYLLAWGEALEDDGTLIIYDYSTGEKKLTRDTPGRDMNAELEETGMGIYTATVSGGVARYVFE